MTNELTPFGQFMRKLRIDKKISTKSMASKLGCTRQYLSLVELGKRNIPSKWVNDIIELYKLSDDEIIDLRDSYVSSVFINKPHDVYLIPNNNKLEIGFYNLNEEFKTDRISIIDFKNNINEDFYNENDDEGIYSLQNFIFSFINLVRTYTLFRNIAELDEMNNMKIDFCYDLITDYNHTFVTDKLYQILDNIYHVFGTKLSIDIYNKRYINIIELILDFLLNIFKLNDTDSLKLIEILNYLYELNLKSYEIKKKGRIDNVN